MRLIPGGIRRAARQMARSPAFTIAAVVTLALGIGASTTMFSVVRGILLRPLPYEQPDRLYRTYLASPERGVENSQLSLPDLEDLGAGSAAFSHLAGYYSFARNLTRDVAPAALRATYVTGDFFPALGTRPHLGRTLGPADLEQDLAAVVLSNRTWRDHFGSDPAIVGSSMGLDGQPHTVVGVMPATFRFPESATDVWVPLSVLTSTDLVPTNRSARWLAAVGRLAPGWPEDRARAEMATLAGRLAEEHPASNRGWDRVTLIGLRESVIGDVGPALLITLAAVFFVLVLVCTNLAGLLLVRATARSHDLTVRAALGAGRARLARDAFTESVLLAALGGASGLHLATLGVQAVRSIGGTVLPRTDDIGVDFVVLAFGALVTLLASVLAGTIPALRAARTDLAAALRDAGRAGTGRGGERTRSALVVVQIALAVVLTIGAGLMLRNLDQLRRTHPGFDDVGVLTARIQVPLPADRAALRSSTIDRADRILAELRALPGVEAAGSVSALPLQPSGQPLPLAAGEDSPPGDAMFVAQPRSVAGDYFRALRIPLVAGETFPELLADGAPTYAVISASTARRLWPGEDAVGRAMWMGIPYRVIGVVGDVSGPSLTEEPPLTVYRDLRQQPLADVTFVVKTSLADPQQLAMAVRQAVWRVDPAQAVTDVRTLDEVVTASLGEDVFFTGMLATFGLLALLLAMLGLYATLAYAVAQRTREIGIRMALGARHQDVLTMVLRRGLVLTLAGVLTGLLAAAATSRVLTALLHEVSPLDPATFAATSLLLLVTAVLAAWIPARRATRSDPLAALRTE